MRIVGFGNIYIDIYLDNNTVSGGKSNQNILCNLAKYFDCCFIGYCGNDINGKIGIKSLKKCGVDTYVKVIDNDTHRMLIKEGEATRRCPFCNKKVNYEGNNIDNNLIQEDDILLIDSLEDNNIEIMNKVSNIVFLDIGYPMSIENKSLDEILLLFSRCNLINMNHRVYDYLNEKYNITKLDLFNRINTELLIITNGIHGVDFLYNNKLTHMDVDNIIDSKYTEGAGDSYFSVVIKNYLNGNIDIEGIHKEASLVSSEVVKKPGARSHLIDNFKILEYDKCICNISKYK